MNYLRSAILAVVSTSTLVLAAGCADAPEGTDDQAPKTEIGGGSGIDPQAPSGGVCPASKPEFYQVQASRIAKYLFGGNDPFTNDPSGESKEYGEYGTVPPKMNAECKKAADFWHKIGESMWQYGGKEGPTTWLGSAPNTTACGLKADLFTMKTNVFTDAEIERGVALTDYCWGVGVSGFIVTGAAAQPPGTCTDAGKDGTTKDGTKGSTKRDGQCTPPVVGAIGFDPEPADLGAPLGASTGATADAKYTNTGTPTRVVEWPASYTAGATLVPGTPCSTYALPVGALTSRAIVAATPTSNLRKCM